MFERTLEEMRAVVTVEHEMYQTATASNVGVPTSLICDGAREYSYDEAISVIRAFDAVLPSCPKGLYKRLRATRMQFAFAFGPEMLTVVGSAPAERT